MVKGTDTFDQIIAIRCLYNITDLIRLQIKGGIFKGLILLTFSKGAGSFLAVTVFQDQLLKIRLFVF